MDLGGRDTLLTLGTAAMLLVGIGLVVVVTDYLLTVVGILLIILSAVIFIVDAKDLIVKTDERAKVTTTEAIRWMFATPRPPGRRAGPPRR